jgi:hypothetical protein
VAGTIAQGGGTLLGRGERVTSNDDLLKVWLVKVIFFMIQELIQFGISALRATQASG